MKNKNLSYRLKYIINFVKTPKSFIDVGCDHGFVGVSLSKSKKVKKLYLNDISEKCLDKAKKNMKDFGDASKCKFDIGFGLEHFDNLKIETCLIAGMGGEEIVKILKNKPKNLKIKNLCLQPATKMIYLKRWLGENNYKVVKDDFFFEDDVFYNIFKVREGKNKLDDIELVFGKQNLKKPSEVFKEFVNVNLQKKLNYAQKGASEKLLDEIKLFEQAKRRIKENERGN